MTGKACATEVWPTELKLAPGGRQLSVSFDDGTSHLIPAELLRVMSPSAEVQGHSARERKTLGGKRTVAIIGIDPIGSYAVKLSFDDMHSTGIYTWAYLHELGAHQEERWNAYLSELDAKGLSRDRAGEARVEG
jgi:DUF971 family protein